MLINVCRNNRVYSKDRKRILGSLSKEDKAENKNLPSLFDYCNFDEESEMEMAKFLTYVTNTDFDKPYIGSGLIIETDDKARVERLAVDIMNSMLIAGFNTGKIYNYSEKDIFAGIGMSVLEAKPGTGDIVITGDLMTGNESEEIKRHMFFQKEAIWGNVLSVFNESRAIKILFATKDIIDERFGGKSRSDLKYPEESFNYRIRLGEMSESNIRNEIIKKLEAEGFTADRNFAKHLDEYIKTVYGRSDLKNMGFADSIYRQIVKENYGKNCSKIIDADSLPAYDKPKSFEEAARELNNMIGLRNIKSFIRELSFLYRSGRLKKDLSSLHMVFFRQRRNR